MAKTFNDYPKAATENAKRALKFREDTDNKNDCGTPVGWARANQLAKREPISLDTVKRMAQFNRHKQHKDVPYEEGCGGLMWDAWGGTEGIEWAIRTVEQEEGNMKSINITEEIGGWGQVDRIAYFLEEAAGDPITINMTSNGGSVFEGLKIASMIRNYSGYVTVKVLGFTASMGTIVSLSADELLIDKYSFFMIHNSRGFFMGDRNDIKKQTRVLPKIDKLMMEVYTDKIESNGKLIDGDREKTEMNISKRMDKEDFLTAQEALDLGLVDGLFENKDKELQESAAANMSAVASYSDTIKSIYNKTTKKMAENKTLLARFAAFLGLTKDEASEVLEGLPEAKEDTKAEGEETKTEAKSDDKKEEKAMPKEDDKKEDEKEDDMEKMKKKLEKLEAENEKLKKDLKEAKEAKNELEDDISNSASYAKGGKEEPKTKSSMFTDEQIARFNEAFKGKFKNA